jgi:thioredoxin-like negative regulator of GroEL
MIITLSSEADLERILEEHDTVVIDFWAPWCGPCLEFAPLFEAAAARHPELAFCRVNSDEEKPLLRAFGVKFIPSLIVIRERVMVAEQPGYLGESAIEDLLEQVSALDMEVVRQQSGARSAESEEEE